LALSLFECKHLVLEALNSFRSLHHSIEQQQSNDSDQPVAIPVIETQLGLAASAHALAQLANQ